MKWRILMGAVALAAAAWSGWWFVGRAAHETALRDWLAARRAAGWQAEAAGISTVGFPNRFDTTISGLSLADTANGWAWSAPFVKIVTLSYKPGQALVALPGEQVVAVPGARGGAVGEDGGVGALQPGRLAGARERVDRDRRSQRGGAGMERRR